MESIHDRIKREREAALQDRDEIRSYREYARGRHRGTLSAEQRTILGGVVEHPFADNVCDVALSAVAARLDLTGFRVESGPVQTFLNELFVKAGLALMGYDVHYRTARDGNHAVGLGWLADDADPVTAPDAEVPIFPRGGRVTIHHEPWWDGKDNGTGVFVAYDSAGVPAYAVKDWDQILGDPPAKRRRRTIYFPDHIERYIQVGGGWQAFPLEGEPANGHVPWRKRDGSPLGIPIVHFHNGRFGDAPYGSSDLAGGVLGLQDEINDIQRDITAAARLTAFQMIAATGVDQSQPGGKIRVGPGRVIGSSNPASRFAAIPAGDMSQLLAAHDKKIDTFSLNTGTPAHMLKSGQWPSGLALIRAEMPLVSRAKRMAKGVGPAWATLAHRATEMANAFGGAGLDEAALITSVFAPPEQLDAQSLAEIDKARIEGIALLATIDDPVLLAKTGLLTDAEVTQIVAARDARAQAAAVAAF